jgi:hypothetical protein
MRDWIERLHPGQLAIAVVVLFVIAVVGAPSVYFAKNKFNDSVVDDCRASLEARRDTDRRLIPDFARLFGDSDVDECVADRFTLPGGLPYVWAGFWLCVLLGVSWIWFGGRRSVIPPGP